MSCPGLNNLLMAYEDKSAYALCAFSFSHGPGAEPRTFLGKLRYVHLSFVIVSAPASHIFCSFC